MHHAYSSNFVYLQTFCLTFIDKISKLCVRTYLQLLNVTFFVIIDCGAFTNHIYGTILYAWNFGNGKSITTYLSSVTATYQSNGAYDFSVFASNNVSQANYTGEVHVESGMIIHIS